MKDSDVFFDGFSFAADSIEPSVPHEDVVEGVRAGYYGRFLDRLMNAIEGKVTAVQAFQIRDFLREYIFFPEERGTRDQAFEVLVDRLKRVKVMGLETNLVKVVELVTLSRSLDDSYTHVVRAGDITSRGWSDDFCSEALRIEGRASDRVKQLELMVEVLDFFCAFCAKPVVRSVMPMAKKAMKILGAHDLVRQIDDGYALSKEFEDFTTLLEAIEANETRFLATAYA